MSCTCTCTLSVEGQGNLNQDRDLDEWDRTIARTHIEIADPCRSRSQTSTSASIHTRPLIAARRLEVQMWLSRGGCRRPTHLRSRRLGELELERLSTNHHHATLQTCQRLTKARVTDRPATRPSKPTQEDRLRLTEGQDRMQKTYAMNLVALELWNRRSRGGGLIWTF